MEFEVKDTAEVQKVVMVDEENQRKALRKVENLLKMHRRLGITPTCCYG
ncbi:hypothetical protein EVA_02579 [gut metagenome]|uniref:Uncharacterized protein n=1 Tax=gut metagenome TaxID=749906 RepID=J9GNR7_9ZZZZ